MGEWVDTKLDEYIVYVSRGVSPKYSDSEGIIVINQKCIRDGKINYDLARLHNREKSFAIEKTLIKKDILINSTGVGTAGRVSIFQEDIEALVDSHVSIVRLDSEKLYPDFLFYNLRGREKELEETAEGSTGQIELKRDGINDLDVKIPLEIDEQKAIAEVLSSLDDKIDLLHRQNKTLESLAETLFRHTFIDNAQDDWEEGTLDDILTVKGGTTPSTKNPNFWDGDILWTTPRDLSNNSGMYLLDTARKITEKGLEKISSGLLPAGTLLLSSRAPVGYLAFSIKPIAINQGYIAILDDKGFSKYFIYLWLLVNMDVVKNHANGSTFQEISKTSFKQIKVTKPDGDILTYFDEKVSSLFKKIEENTLQIQTLEQLRDTLLPRLMSGEVRVRYDEVA